MSKKESMYFPKYQSRRGEDEVVISREIQFYQYDGVYFITKIPLFGTKKIPIAALKWASCHTSPVTCVKYEAPCAPDIDTFNDPNDSHRTYYPYVMAIATLFCLGEEKPRKIKIYFCYLELHEENAFAKTHSRSKGTYIVPIDY